MGGIKGFWRHVDNGGIYAIESTPFGQVLGAVGPLDAEHLQDLGDYIYTEKINIWIEQALIDHKLHRFNPSS